MNKGADKDSFMFVVIVRFWQHHIPILASVFRQSENKMANMVKAQDRLNRLFFLGSHIDNKLTAFIRVKFWLVW